MPTEIGLLTSMQDMELSKYLLRKAPSPLFFEGGKSSYFLSLLTNSAILLSRVFLFWGLFLYFPYIIFPLKLGNNEFLTGTLPTEIGNLEFLTELRIGTFGRSSSCNSRTFVLLGWILFGTTWPLFCFFFRPFQRETASQGLFQPN